MGVEVVCFSNYTRSTWALLYMADQFRPSPFRASQETKPKPKLLDALEQARSEETHIPSNGWLETSLNGRSQMLDVLVLESLGT